jgi:hypothetical protein
MFSPSFTLFEDSSLIFAILILKFICEDDRSLFFTIIMALTKIYFIGKVFPIFIATDPYFW